MAGQEMERLVVQLAEHARSRYYGKYRGIVREVDEKLGRIIAEVPAVYGEVLSPWAWPCVPFAGSGHGLVLLPEKGDGVWVEFEEGDPSRPVWVGGWWADGELPDPGAAKTRALVTSKKHKIVVDDDKGEIQLVHAGGATITIKAKEITLKVGASQITLSASGVNINNGALVVK